MLPEYGLWRGTTACWSLSTSSGALVIRHPSTAGRRFPVRCELQLRVDGGGAEERADHRRKGTNVASLSYCAAPRLRAPPPNEQPQRRPKQIDVKHVRVRFGWATSGMGCALRSSGVSAPEGTDTD